jgi:hypothetical protein
MGSACSTYWGEESTYRVLMGKPEGRRPREDPGVDERIILKWILEQWDGGVGGLGWIDLAQDRDRWRAVVNVVM